MASSGEEILTKNFGGSSVTQVASIQEHPEGDTGAIQTKLVEPVETTVVPNGYITILEDAKTSVSAWGDGNVTLLIEGTYRIIQDDPNMKEATSAVTESPNDPTSTPSITESSQLASSTLPELSESVAPSPSTNVSAGALAGAVVGSLVAGLLIGILAGLWFIRRKKRHQSNVEQVAVVPNDKQLPNPPGTASDLAMPSAGGIQLSQFLIDATPDNELSSELQALSSLIQQHVEQFYHLQPVSASTSSLVSRLSSLDFSEHPTHGQEVSAADIVDICIDSKTRQVGLRHVISTVVFQSIDPQSPSRHSVLPSHLTSLMRSFPPPEQDDKQERVFSPALTLWRSLSAFLLHPNRSHRTPLEPDESSWSPQIFDLGDTLNDFLQQFVLSDLKSRDDQSMHLNHLVFECAKFGYKILSQPRDWQFVFQADSNTRALVVCPGLEKAGSEQQARKPALRRILDPRVEKI